MAKLLTHSLPDTVERGEVRGAPGNGAENDGYQLVVGGLSKCP